MVQHVPPHLLVSSGPMAPITRFGIAAALNYLLYGNVLTIGGTQFAYSEESGLCIQLINPNPTEDQEAIEFIPVNISLKDFVNKFGPFITPALVKEIDNILWKQEMNRSKGI